MDNIMNYNEFFEEQLKTLKSNIVEMKGIMKRDIFDSGEVGVNSFIEYANFRR